MALKFKRVEVTETQAILEAERMGHKRRAVFRLNRKAGKVKCMFADGLPHKETHRQTAILRRAMVKGEI